MRLTKRVNRREGDKTFWKYSLDITPSLIEELGWDKGLNLDGTVVGDTLVLRPKTRANED